MKEKLMINAAAIIYPTTVIFCAWLIIFAIVGCSTKIQPPETLLVNVGHYNDFTVECNEYEVDIIDNCSYHLVCWIYEDNRKEIIFEGFYTQKVECAWLRMQR